MLTIRFARVGRKNRAQFRIVLQESTNAPTGKHVAVLGSYDPHQKIAVLKSDKIKEWLGKGAQASDSVHNLLVKEGVVSGEKRKIKMSKPEVKDAPAEEAKVEGATPKEEKAEEVVPEEKKEEVKAE